MIIFCITPRDVWDAEDAAAVDSTNDDDNDDDDDDIDHEEDAGKNAVLAEAKSNKDLPPPLLLNGLIMSKRRYTKSINSAVVNGSRLRYSISNSVGNMRNNKHKLISKQ